MDRHRTIAVFGGTFDPPHVGHVLVVAYVRSIEGVDRVMVVPTYEHPLGKAPSAGYEHRVQMCERMLEPFTGVEVSRIEQELGGVSHTLTTLEELARRQPEDRLRLVVGADVLPQTARWHRWDRIVELAEPIVVGRAGYPRPEGCAIEIPDVSSTELRRELGRRPAAGRRVPRRVEEYIDEHGLYREETEA